MILRDKLISGHGCPIELSLSLHGHRSKKVEIMLLLLLRLLPIQVLHLAIE